jgi:peptidyl-dipeptidase A
METVYNSAKICPFKKQQCDLDTEGLTLDPEMAAVLSESEDYEELEYTWKAWRDASGKKMRSDYKTYVDLVNEAAKLNGE